MTRATTETDSDSVDDDDPATEGNTQHTGSRPQVQCKCSGVFGPLAKSCFLQSRLPGPYKYAKQLPCLTLLRGFGPIFYIFVWSR